MKKRNTGYIIFSIVSGISGAYFCYCGKNMNSDIERQFESFWNTGTKDSMGDMLYYTGIICFILCVVFAAIAIAIAVINYNHSLNGDNSSVPHNNLQKPYAQNSYNNFGVNHNPSVQHPNTYNPNNYQATPNTYATPAKKHSAVDTQNNNQLTH